MPLDPGSRLGPYEIVAPLGAGGMGEVYRARDPRLGRDVAVKVLPQGPAAQADVPTAPGASPLLSREEQLRRFEQEARAVAALSHPNVLAIFDIGVGTLPFLVTELLEGETLRALLERGPLTPQRSDEIALQIAAGLAAAHARGIVHRDLKPGNIFVTGDGQVKILDFGLARHVGSSADAARSITRSHTVPGTVLGTLGYMAPEQVRGLDADHRADIFALGAILFEMLTGQRAFSGESPADTISAILKEPPSTLLFSTTTPPALAAVVRRCLEKDVQQRFQSAREVARALESISDAQPAIGAGTPGTKPTSIAVLPFVNLSADPENEYFSEGLAEELINGLARLSGLRVASRTASFRFRGGDADVREIGRELGAGAILEGSVRRAGARLRITVRLTNAADGYLIWSERYDREMADVFDVEDEIVASIVAALEPALLGEAKASARRGTENLQAYELYLKGRYFWNQRSPAVVGTAIRYFEEAIALDPAYALAYAGLADCYSILRVYGWTPAEHSQHRALDAVTRAIALDPGLPEAHFSKALYTFHFERRWRSARQHFLDALSLNPRNAMFEAYFALFLATEYEYGESRRRIDRALELDPHSSVVHFLAASTACAMTDPSAAERHAARALQLQPESLGPRWPETVALLASGRYDEAIAAADRVVARTRAPIYLGVLGMVYGCAGRIADARRLAQELDERQGRGEYIVPVARLSVQLGLKDVAGIRAALAACVDGGTAPFSVVSTNRWLLDTYRHDAEIDRLLDRLHDGARPPRTGPDPITET
ncbi:MAG TPA: protein kinase [Vicinamibacterales bacterium]|nr:protein kinase [Vicinamibacterales bacterium]